MRRPPLFLSLVVALGALSPIPQAAALSTQVRSISAGWVNEFAAPATPATTTSKGASERSVVNPLGAHVDKRSTINIDFNTIPTAYQPAVQAAVDAWSSSFTSKIPINVNATWDRMGSSTILASATPVKYFNNFAGAPDKELWYASVLANILAGKDLDPKNPEISISINSTVAPTFYAGTDGNCPDNRYDLESVVLHELGHGMGFLSNSEYLTFGYGNIAKPTPYDAYAQLPDGRRLMDLPSPSIELGSALTSSLVWSGFNGVAANNGIKPKLYTPVIYEPGSSVSHLDLATFGSIGENAVMAPNLAPGEIFHAPGSLLLAILQDLLQKPPAGTPSGIPQSPRNVLAIVGDRSALITFDPPANARTSQVSSYSVKVNQTGATQVTNSSPLLITGLKNGSTYSFTITAKNTLGTSDGATTNGVIPMAPWPSTVIDASAGAKNIATTTFQGKPVIAYSDPKNGDLKLATFTGKSWNKEVIDGNATTGVKSADDVSGNISICSGKIGKVETLNIFYADLTTHDLRYAGFDGTKWSYSIVDGNGPKIQPYQESARVRTASDVSVSSACVQTAAGLQVFYRDESQGILLGAVKDGTKWRYELVDGDRLTDNRTTGDVAFHLKAANVGNHVYLLYDSVLSVDQEKTPLRGELRLAQRDTAYPEDWNYSTVDTSGNGVTIAGFDVALSISGKSALAGWLVATGISAPDAAQIRWVDLASGYSPQSLPTDYYGRPSAPLSQDKSGLLFGCEKRLCAINKADQTFSLVSSDVVDSTARTQWITFGAARYALLGVNGKLLAFKAPK
jgi:hypothetical protein